MDKINEVDRTTWSKEATLAMQKKKKLFLGLYKFCFQSKNKMIEQHFNFTTPIKWAKFMILSEKKL